MEQIKEKTSADATDKSNNEGNCDDVNKFPENRAAHTACLIGKGQDAKMLIVGGSNTQMGSGKSGIVANA